MKGREYDKVCYMTEQRDEPVTLRNLKSGEVGQSFGCTYDGETIQVRLQSGQLDSWRKDDCVEVEQ